MNEIRSASVTVCLCATTQLSQFTFRRRRQPYLSSEESSAWSRRSHFSRCAHPPTPVPLEHARPSLRERRLQAISASIERNMRDNDRRRRASKRHGDGGADGARGALAPHRSLASHRTPPRHDVRIVSRRAHPGVALPNVVGVRAARHLNPRDLPCTLPRLLMAWWWGAPPPSLFSHSSAHVPQRRPRRRATVPTTTLHAARTIVGQRKTQARDGEKCSSQVARPRLVDARDGARVRSRVRIVPHPRGLRRGAAGRARGGCRADRL